MAIDLHIHSSYSDGTMAPAQLVHLAKRRGLQAIAITDHDTVAGVEEALAAGRTCGLQVIAGLELSVTWQSQPIHLLGYFLDHTNQGLLTTLARLQRARVQRNLAILERLAGLGIEITIDDVARFSDHGEVGRPHIAQALVKAGAVHSLDEAFRRYLRNGAAAYVERDILDIDEALALLLGAGGLPVLAHPATHDPALTGLAELLEFAVPRGLQGLEVYYPTHSKKIRKKLLAIADSYNLVVTGGSDYHGDIRPQTSLAGTRKLQVPLELLGPMVQRQAELTGETGRANSSSIPQC